MKKVLVLFAVLILAVSLTSCKTSEQEMAKFAIETAGMVAGQMAASEGIVMNPVMNEYYQKVMAGNLVLNETEFLRIQTYLAADLGLNPLIVNRILAVTKLAGAEIEGGMVELEGVDMELIKAGLNGFMLGLTMPRNVQ